MEGEPLVTQQSALKSSNNGRRGGTDECTFSSGFQESISNADEGYRLTMRQAAKLLRAGPLTNPRAEVLKAF